MRKIETSTWLGWIGTGLITTAVLTSGCVIWIFDRFGEFETKAHAAEVNSEAGKKFDRLECKVDVILGRGRWENCQSKN